MYIMKQLEQFTCGGDRDDPRGPEIEQWTQETEIVTGNCKTARTVLASEDIADGADTYCIPKY